MRLVTTTPNFVIRQRFEESDELCFVVEKRRSGSVVEYFSTELEARVFVDGAEYVLEKATVQL